ncbi:MAG: PASTA domain-containing protein, partial [Flavobacteriaceae bacterium]|nr:PASTA domain-containing protein [Flavobacteriaceae bacterium]
QIYGADVAGPVFKSIAQNVLTETPYISEISIAQIEDVLGPTNSDQLELPNFLGMQKDDVRTILKNLDVEFQIKGEGIVTQQSEEAGTPITQIDNLELILS